MHQESYAAGERRPASLRVSVLLFSALLWCCVGVPSIHSVSRLPSLWHDEGITGATERRVTPRSGLMFAEAANTSSSTTIDATSSTTLVGTTSATDAPALEGRFAPDYTSRLACTIIVTVIISLVMIMGIVARVGEMQTTKQRHAEAQVSAQGETCTEMLSRPLTA